MSGDAEIPPTYYFSGITFNPSFYQSSSTDYLTLETAKSSFLTYPTAQGDETIDQIYSQNISSITPTEAFNFLDSQTANIYIGENTTGTSGQIIQIGAPALTTVKVGAISIKDSTIDTLSATTAMKIGSNLTTAGLTIGGTQTGTGFINIGKSQISGTMEIATSATRTGALYINSTSGATNTVYLGSIGTTTIIDGNTLTLGSASSTIKVGASQTSGTMEIATSDTRTGALYINSTTGATNSVYLGAAGTTTVIDGNTLTLGSASTATTNTNTFTSTGLITANGGINVPTGKLLTVVGTQTSTGLITANGGVSATTLSASSTISATGLISANDGLTIATGKTLKTDIIDTSTISTTLKLGSNITDANIEIGGALTSGDIIIGNNNTTGATITVGKTLTETTINGKLTGFNGIISGKSRVVVATAATVTISNLTYNNDFYLIINRGTSTSSVVLPLAAISTAGQVINIRNVGSGSITVYYGSSTSPTAFIVLIGNTTYASGVVDRYTITGGVSRHVIFDGTYWVEF